jgi:hypothetical protein
MTVVIMVMGGAVPMTTMIEAMATGSIPVMGRIEATSAIILGESAIVSEQIIALAHEIKPWRSHKPGLR